MNVSGRLYKIKFILNSISFFSAHFCFYWMYLRCPRKIFLLHRNILHYYKLHPQKCKKKSIYISNYYGHYCQMPVNYLQNLARPFLSKNSNLNYYTEKKTHWKNPKTYSGFIFCCSLDKAFTQLPHKNCWGFFSECVNFLNVFVIKS